MQLFDLHEDVLALIVQELDLQDVLRLEAVCSGLNRGIRQSRAIWFNFLALTASKHMLRVPDGSPWDETRESASSLRTLVRRNAILQGSQRISRSLSSCPVECLPITWMELVQGRWLVIAESDSKSSYITCWAISHDTKTFSKLTTISICGPVTDGSVQYDISNTIVAVTVEKWPWSEILVFDLDLNGDSAEFIFKQQLDGSSVVLLINELFVGYAVQDGDNEFAYIKFHKIQESHPLVPRYPVPTPHKHHNCEATLDYDAMCIQRECLAMHLIDDFLLVAYTVELRIFKLEGCKRPTHIGSFTLVAINSPCRSVSFLPVPSQPSPFTNPIPSLSPHPCCLIAAKRATEIYPVVEIIGVNYEKEKDYKFSKSRLVTLGSVETYELWNQMASPLRVGSMAHDIFWSSGLLHQHPQLQRVSVDECVPGMPLNVRSFHRLDLPLLYKRSTICFDDARGIVVVGNIAGELRLIDYADAASWSCPASESLSSVSLASGVGNALSDQRLQSLTFDSLPCDKFHEFPVLYRHETTPDGRCLNMEKQNLITSIWKTPVPFERPNSAVSPESDAYSDDWSLWSPISEWYPICNRHRHEPNVVIGNSMDVIQGICGVRGMPIPILWSTPAGKTHKTVDEDDLVVFRIGKRPFVWCGQELILVPLSATKRHLSIDEIFPDVRAHLDITNQLKLTEADGHDSRWVESDRHAAFEEMLAWVAQQEESEYPPSPELWSDEDCIEIRRLQEEDKEAKNPEPPLRTHW